MASSRLTKHALVRVLGCKVNQAEAAAMTRILEEAGYSVNTGAAEPDLIVVNTCCVTARAEAKSRRAVNRLAEQHPHATVMVTGCLAEINPSSLAQEAHERIVLGARAKDRFKAYVAKGNRTARDMASSDGSEEGGLGYAVISGRSRAFLKVQDGCSQFCSYCIVPHARGPSRSLPESEVIKYARELENQGFAEIVLTGIHLGMYGRDLLAASSLEALILRILQACSSVRLRLSSVEPQEITSSIVELVTASSRVCRHLHIPLQSGDDEILRRMGRPYATDQIVDLVDRIRNASRETCIGMDILAAFPGEEDASFERTRRLVERLQPSYLHVFPFSPRPGTPAATFTPRIPPQTAQRRVNDLRDLSESLRRSFYREMVGRTFDAVPEDDSATDTNEALLRTDNYIPVKVRLTRETEGRRRFLVRLDGVVEGEVIGSVIG